jgi:hypothetical protein
MSYAVGFLALGAIAAGTMAAPAWAQSKPVAAQAAPEATGRTFRTKDNSAGARPLVHKPRSGSVGRVRPSVRALPRKASEETKSLMGGIKSQLIDIFSTTSKMTGR